MKTSLEETARALVADGKGILAADESLPTIEKRLKGVGVASTGESRGAYRELLLGAPGLGDSISGVILFDETLRQLASSGRPMVELLTGQGIIPGIKVDRGAKALAGFPGEKVTEGLDGLRDRLKEYGELGARFTKWRAVIKIGDGIPTPTALRSNAHALARFAALSQEAGLVPIVEPEVLMNGAHDLARCEAVTTRTLEVVFEELRKHRVLLEGMLLKASMVISGSEAEGRASVQSVAEATRRTLLRTVPAAVPGIVFLSGGQGDVEATQHLDAINRVQPAAPWQLSFSFGRALQAPALAKWHGENSRVKAAREILLHRARCNGAAARGAYTAALEKP